MTRHNPHYRTREQYSSYYQGPPSSYPQESPYPPEEFAPPSRSSRVAPSHRGRPQQSVSAPPRSRRRSRSQRPRNVWLAGGGMLALAAFMVGPKPFLDRNRAEDSTSTNVVCEETVQSASVLSRAELSKLLAVAERAPKEEVRAVIDEPYCTLPSVKVREGAVSEREAYPLEFNPQTWFIVLYEEGEYAGFDFSFNRD